MAESPANDRTTGARIWILDDDVALCRLLEPRLRSLGWQTRSFPVPQALMEALVDECPDLLVLDQMLPEKPGTHVLANLRQAGMTFPVLMLSALGAPADRISGLEMGADDYLTKPFAPRELQLRIERLLLLSQAGPPSASAPAPAPPAPPAEPLQLGSLRFDPSACSLTDPAGTTLPLSRGDTALLLLLGQALGQVLSRDTLARSSGSLVDASTSRSLDVRLSRLRRLLDEAAAGTLRIESVRGAGYRLRLEEAADGD